MKSTTYKSLCMKYMHPLKRMDKIIPFCVFIGVICTSVPVSVAAEPETPTAAVTLTPVIMQLDWIFNAQFAGLYQAEHRGYFRDAGLAVEIRPTRPNQPTVMDVMTTPGIVFGCAESNVLLQGRANGAAIVALATMFQASPIGWMYLLSSGIETLEDLAGRRIAIHTDGEKILAAMTRSRGISLEDYTLPQVGHNPAPLLAGEVDAMQCYVIDEFVKLQLETGGKGGVILAKDYGYVAYSQTIFTREEIIRDHPDLVRAFLKAVQKGWTYALDHPEETVDLILAHYNPSLDREYQLGSLAQIEALVRPGSQAPLAPLRLEVFKQSEALYLEQGLLPQGTNPETWVLTEFNP